MRKTAQRPEEASEINQNKVLEGIEQKLKCYLSMVGIPMPEVEGTFWRWRTWTSLLANNGVNHYKEVQIMSQDRSK